MSKRSNEGSIRETDRGQDDLGMVGNRTRRSIRDLRQEDGSGVYQWRDPASKSRGVFAEEKTGKRRKSNRCKKAFRSIEPMQNCWGVEKGKR